MDPIRYFNRYTATIDTEEVYGEGFLKFAYGNPLGKLALHAFVKRAAFSKWYGWRMDKPSSAAKVAAFIDQYKLDAGEFVKRPEGLNPEQLSLLLFRLTKILCRSSFPPMVGTLLRQTFLRWMGSL